MKEDEAIPVEREKKMKGERKRQTGEGRQEKGKTENREEGERQGPFKTLCKETVDM